MPNVQKTLSNVTLLDGQTYYFEDEVARALGLSDASVGDLVRVDEVDTNGKPTSWTHVSLSDIVTNQNLLDNWYFGPGVINQHGISEVGGNKNYIVDRWKGYGWSTAKLSIISNGVQIVNESTGTEYLRQFLNTPLPAGKYTLSALIESVTGSGTIGFLSVRHGIDVVVSESFTEPGLVTLTFVTDGVTTPVDNVGFTCTKNNAVIVSAIKLEVGDTQTLAHRETINDVEKWVLNEVPNYGKELLKCQRYFQRFKTEAFRPISRYDYRPEMAVNPQSGATDVNQPTLDEIIINGTTYYTASVEP